MKMDSGKPWEQEVTKLSLTAMTEEVRQAVIKTMKFTLAVMNGSDPSIKQEGKPSLEEKFISGLSREKLSKDNVQKATAVAETQGVVEPDA